MSKIKNMIPFRTGDGTEWGVDVELPGFSSAMIIFHHPDGSTARKDRYARYDWHGPEANDNQARITAAQVRKALDQKTLAHLFTRSMLIGTGRPAFPPA